MQFTSEDRRLYNAFRRKAMHHGHESGIGSLRAFSRKRARKTGAPANARMCGTHVSFPVCLSPGSTIANVMRVDVSSASWYEDLCASVGAVALKSHGHVLTAFPARRLPFIGHIRAYFRAGVTTSPLCTAGVSASMPVRTPERYRPDRRQRLRAQYKTLVDTLSSVVGASLAQTSDWNEFKRCGSSSEWLQTQMRAAFPTMDDESAESVADAFFGAVKHSMHECHRLKTLRDQSRRYHELVNGSMGELSDEALLSTGDSRLDALSTVEVESRQRRIEEERARRHVNPLTAQEQQEVDNEQHTITALLKDHLMNRATKLQYNLLEEADLHNHSVACATCGGKNKKKKGRRGKGKKGAARTSPTRATSPSIAAPMLGFDENNDMDMPPLEYGSARAPVAAPASSGLRRLTTQEQQQIASQRGGSGTEAVDDMPALIPLHRGTAMVQDAYADSDEEFAGMPALIPAHRSTAMVQDSYADSDEEFAGMPALESHSAAVDSLYAGMPALESANKKVSRLQDFASREAFEDHIADYAQHYRLYAMATENVRAPTRMRFVCLKPVEDFSDYALNKIQQRAGAAAAIKAEASQMTFRHLATSLKTLPRVTTAAHPNITFVLLDAAPEVDLM